MSKADAAAAILWIGVTFYALFGERTSAAGSGTWSPAGRSAASGRGR